MLLGSYLTSNVSNLLPSVLVSGVSDTGVWVMFLSWWMMFPSVFNQVVYFWLWFAGGELADIHTGDNAKSADVFLPWSQANYLTSVILSDVCLQIGFGAAGIHLYSVCSRPQIFPTEPTSRNANTSVYRNVFTIFVYILQGKDLMTGWQRERESVHTLRHAHFTCLFKWSFFTVTAYSNSIS